MNNHQNGSSFVGRSTNPIEIFSDDENGNQATLPPKKSKIRIIQTGEEPPIIKKIHQVTEFTELTENKEIQTAVNSQKFDFVASFFEKLHELFQFQSFKKLNISSMKNDEFCSEIFNYTEELEKMTNDIAKCRSDCLAKDQTINSLQANEKQLVSQIQAQKHSIMSIQKLENIVIFPSKKIAAPEQANRYVHKLKKFVDHAYQIEKKLLAARSEKDFLNSSYLFSNQCNMLEDIRHEQPVYRSSKVVNKQPSKNSKSVPDDNYVFLINVNNNQIWFIDNLTVYTIQQAFQKKGSQFMMDLMKKQIIEI